MKPATPTTGALLRSYVLPLLWLFAIPALAAWFFQHAAARYDRPYLQRVDALQLEGKLNADAAAGWRANPPSTICASGDARFAKLLAKLPCSSYAQFRWGQRLAWGGLALGLIGVLLVGLLVGLSLVSQRSLYLSFRAGWVLLRIISAFEVVSQGVLLVGLSYWVTAIWFSIYVPKLILMVAVLALFAVGLLLKATFQRLARAERSIAGAVISRSAAPELWEHIDSICVALGTAPPDSLVVGIDASCFVTEHPLTHEGRELSGRTLYLSLPLLRALERDEASAVLAHEMAHFSGEDTLYGKKLSPQLERFVRYLGALHEGGVSMPVFYFMLAYWTLFQLSLSHIGRQRELRADRIAAEHSSPEAFGRALLKISAYCSFQSKVEAGVFEDKSLSPDLRLAEKVAQGFAHYAASPELDALFEGDPKDFGHPFDEHPPLSRRLAAVGFSSAVESYRQTVAEEPHTSWAQVIREGDRLEARLWQERENAFESAHQQMMAYHLAPASREEQAIVEERFPAKTFPRKKAGAAAVLSFDGVHSPEDGLALKFGQIASVKLEEAMMKKYLSFKLRDGSKERLCLSRLEVSADGPFLAHFERYYGRHLAAQAYLAEQAKEKGSPQQEAADACGA